MCIENISRYKCAWVCCFETDFFFALIARYMPEYFVLVILFLFWFLAHFCICVIYSENIQWKKCSPVSDKRHNKPLSPMLFSITTRRKKEANVEVKYKTKTASHKQTCVIAFIEYLRVIIDRCWSLFDWTKHNMFRNICISMKTKININWNIEHR